MGKYNVIGLMSHNYTPNQTDRYRKIFVGTHEMRRDIGVWTFDEPDQADQMVWKIANFTIDLRRPNRLSLLVSAFREFTRECCENARSASHVFSDLMREMNDGGVTGLVEVSYTTNRYMTSIYPVDEVSYDPAYVKLTIKNADWLGERKLAEDFPIFACFETMSLG